MAGQADLVRQVVEDRRYRPQNIAHIAFDLRAAGFEHRPVLTIDNLDAQPFVHHVDQQMWTQRLQARIGFNQFVKLFTQLIQAQLFGALVRRIDLFSHQAVLLRRIVAAPWDWAAFGTALVAAGQGDLKRRAEIFGDLRQLLRAGDRQQPHHQEERHHRRHKIGISDLPGAAVMSGMMRLALSDQNDRMILFHASSSSVACCAGAFTRRTCSSSSTKEGRSVVYSVLRPNSTAICGA